MHSAAYQQIKMASPTKVWAIFGLILVNFVGLPVATMRK